MSGANLSHSGLVQVLNPPRMSSTHIHVFEDFFGCCNEDERITKVVFKKKRRSNGSDGE